VCEASSKYFETASRVLLVFVSVAATCRGPHPILGTRPRDITPDKTKTSSHTWEVFPGMGRLPIYGKISHTWEDFPYMGRFSIYGKTSHVWGDFPN
jgi:hypothetical protein